MKWPKPSQISGRSIRVWQRNFSIYRQNWKISFVPPLLEPLLYILAFGVGLAVLFLGAGSGWTRLIGAASPPRGRRFDANGAPRATRMQVPNWNALRGWCPVAETRPA